MLIVSLLLMKITTIIFDFDGVISPDNSTMVYNKFKNVIGDKSFETKMLANKKFYQCLMGQISFTEFNEEVAKIANIDKKTAEHMSSSIIDTRILDPDVMHIVTQLKEAGFKLILYSDEMKVRFDQWIRKLGLRDVFDSQLCSAYIGTLKSNPDSFSKVLTFLKKKPEECVFIDDNPANVVSAKQANINGILFQDATQLSHELEDFNIVF